MGRAMPYDPSSLRRAAATAIVGATVWEIGIAPVPRVYVEQDPARRLELLQAGERGWIIGHHVAAAGTAAVPAAFGRVALAMPPGRARFCAGVGAVALAAGAPFFVAELARRASDIEAFAAHRLPAWPFAAYAWLHVCALASLAGALWNLAGHRKAATAVGLAAAGTGVALAGTGDIPPFVFYLGEELAAVSLLRRGKREA